MHRDAKIRPLACLAVLLFLSLSCSTLTGGKDDTARTDADASPAATAGAADSGPAAMATPDASSGPSGGGESPAGSTPEPVADGGPYLGDYQTADGYFFAALEVADPAEPSILYEEEEGMRLVGVRLIIGNRDGGQFYFSISDVAVEDTQGDVWEAEYGMLDVEISSNYIDPGERVQGWLGFIIPADRGAETLVYLYDWLDEKSVYLPLAAPPAGHDPLRADTARSPHTDSDLGQAAEGSGFSLTAFGVDESPDLSFPDIFEPPAGWHLVSVEVEIVNNGDESWIFTAFDLSLVDSEGFLYAVDYFYAAEMIESGEIAPGDSVRGWAPFIVPDGTVLESIKLYTEMMDGPLYAGLSE